MKSASGPLAALINSGRFDVWEVYTFTLAGGGFLLLSAAPVAVKGDSWTWAANGPVVTDGQTQQRAHWKCGVDVDSWQLSLAPRLKDPVTGAAFPDTVGDQPMLAGLRAGLLDGADMLVQRAYFNPDTLLSPGPVGGQAPIGFLTVFRGLVADVDLTTSSALITGLDYRQLLTTQMPRNIYQAGCEHTLYDSGCKLSSAAFAKTGHVTSFSSRSQFSTDAPVPAGSHDYTLGRVTMTSGENAGLTRTIQFWDGVNFIQVAPPFPFKLQVGDAATLYPGCNKTTAHCTAFANLVNFGGDPFIPPPTTTGV